MIIGLNESVNVTPAVMIEHSNRDGDLTVVIPGPSGTVTKNVIPKTPTITCRTVTVAVETTVHVNVIVRRYFAGGSSSWIDHSMDVSVAEVSKAQVYDALEFVTVDIKNVNVAPMGGTVKVTVIGRS